MGNYLDLQKIDQRRDEICRYLVHTYDAELDEELTDLSIQFLDALGQIAWTSYLIEAKDYISPLVYFQEHHDDDGTTD